MSKQTFTTGNVLTAAQMNTLQANDYNQTVSAKTASYVLVAADAGTTITMSNASATTITVNTSLFSAGDTLFITNIGAGVCTITAGTATVSTSSSLALTQYQGGTLYFSSAGVAIYYGDVAGMTNPLTTTGDTIYSSSGTTAARLPIGSSNQALGVTGGIPAWQASSKSTLTTTGDTLYASAANTLQRLAIGSSGNVLTVAGGVPTWAAPAGGGGMTVLASGSLSGSSLDLTSISASYNDLQLVLRNFYFDNAANCKFTINNTTGIYAVNSLNEVSSNAMSDTDVALTAAAVREQSNNYNVGVVTFNDYASTTSYKTIVSQVISQNNTTPANRNLTTRNIWAATNSAISRITLTPSFGSFSGGTYILYGVK